MAEDLQRRMAQIDETLAPAKRVVENLGSVDASQLGVVLNCVRQTMVNLLLPLPEVIEPEAPVAEPEPPVVEPQPPVPTPVVEPEAPVPTPVVGSDPPIAEVTPDP